jgi:hypothetical protein
MLLRLFGSVSLVLMRVGLSQYRFKQGRRIGPVLGGVGSGVKMSDCRFQAFVLVFVASSSVLSVERKDFKLEQGVSDNDFKAAGLGLGVRVGVGRPWKLLTRASGVRDKGLRLRLAGRGRVGEGFVSAIAGETRDGSTSKDFIVTSSSFSFRISSSSSSSSMRV